MSSSIGLLQQIATIVTNWFGQPLLMAVFLVQPGRAIEYDSLNFVVIHLRR